MKQSQTVFAGAILVICLASSVSAADIKVIANASITATSVSAEELKGVFLLTKTSITDGGHVVPVLAKGGPAHEAFLKEYVGKSDTALATYYRSLVFTGKASMPKTVDSDAEVEAYVARTKGAIGYVSTDAAGTDFKVLEVK